MPSRSTLAAASRLLLAVAGLGALLLTARASRDAPVLYEDEREFATAAAHLARDGVLSFAPLATTEPRAGCFREPGYPALVALAWRLGGAPPASDDEIARLPEQARPWRAARALNLLLATLAALAAAFAVTRLAGATAGALAFALVAASPALGATASQLMSENLAAAHLALAAAALLLLARHERALRWGALALVALLPLTRAEGVLLLPAAFAVDFAAVRRHARARARRTAPLVALVLLLPAALWMARNLAQTGHAVLTERGGLALAVRAELDADVARHGALSAALAWTPLAAAQDAAERRAPEARWRDQRPTGPGNFYLRTLRAWQQARAVPGADPLAVDAAFGRQALGRIVRSPWAHARAGAAVAVRGLFAERSPACARPFDLSFAFGLLLAAGLVVVSARALMARALATLAWLAPAWILFAFHVAATELLPRYAVPLLPLAWASLALATFSRRASK